MREVFAFLVTLALQGDGQPSAEKVLELALKQRQAITKFTGTFKCDMEKNNAQTRKFAFTFWLDGKKLRQDKLVGNRITDCRNCEKDGQFIHFNSTKVQGNPVSMEFGTMPGDGKKGDTNYQNMFFYDPRVFGLQTASIDNFHAYALDTLLGGADRTAPSLEKTRWNGQEAYLVQFTRTTSQAKVSFWIVPEMDYSVVQVESAGTVAGKSFNQSLKCEMERYGKPGVWFPKSYVAEGALEGKSAWKEKMQISDVKINEAIPADTFRMVGMNIPAGWPVHGSALPNKNKRYEWDGTDLVERKAANKRDRPKNASESPSSHKNGMLLTAAGGLSVFGATALAIFFWKR
jgi:hypothetical protein